MPGSSLNGTGLQTPHVSADTTCSRQFTEPARVITHNFNDQIKRNQAWTKQHH